MMSLRSDALAAYEASQSDRAGEARAALATVLSPFDVTPLTVEDIEVTDTSTLVVFTDGDVHLGVRTRNGTWDVHLVEPAGDGTPGWAEEGPGIESLAHLGKVLPDFDPTDENATPTYPAWDTGIAVAVGDRYTYGGFTWEVVQAHTTQADWTPDATPSLWVKVI